MKTPYHAINLTPRIVNPYRIAHSHNITLMYVMSDQFDLLSPTSMYLLLLLLRVRVSFSLLRRDAEEAPQPVHFIEPC